MSVHGCLVVYSAFFLMAAGKGSSPPNTLILVTQLLTLVKRRKDMCTWSFAHKWLHTHGNGIIFLFCCKDFHTEVFDSCTLYLCMFLLLEHHQRLSSQYQIYYTITVEVKQVFLHICKRVCALLPPCRSRKASLPPAHENKMAQYQDNSRTKYSSS